MSVLTNIISIKNTNSGWSVLVIYERLHQNDVQRKNKCSRYKFYVMSRTEENWFLMMIIKWANSFDGGLETF